MSGKPETKPTTEWTEGFKAGWQDGYLEGKGAGYTDAKVRARLALEAACDSLELPRHLRDHLIRCNNNVLGTVE